MPKPTAAEQQTFAEHTAAFAPVTPAELAHIIKCRQTAVVFLGRASCSYCRRFAPKLQRAAAQTGVSVRFADSSGKAAWADFREEHDIDTVPALMKILSDGLHVVCNSKLSEQDIEKFLTS